MGGGHMAPQPENRPFSVEKMKFFKNGWTEKYLGGNPRHSMFVVTCNGTGVFVHLVRTPFQGRIVS